MSVQGERAVAITGANGYVGSALRNSFLAAGYRVICLQRKPGGGDVLPYSLERGPGAPLPDGLTGLIHCAYDLRARDPGEIERINLGGCERLLRAAGDVRVVHISSMSAYPGTRQIYGRTKLACEELVSAHGGTSLRLGLVHGGVSAGMIGALRRVAALPVVPMLRPDSYQYLLHVEDMVRCVMTSLEQPLHQRVVGVAHPRRVPFSEVVLGLRPPGKPIRPVPVPTGVLYRSLLTAEAAGIRIGFRADSLLGLIHPAPEVPHADIWAAFGIDFRDYHR